MLACGTFLLSSSCPLEVETQAPRLMSNYSNCKVKMHVKRTEQILAVRSAVAAAVLLLYFIEMQRKVALLMHYSDLFYIWQNLERNQQGWKIPRIKREDPAAILSLNSLIAPHIEDTARPEARAATCCWDQPTSGKCWMWFHYLLLRPCAWIWVKGFSF